MDVNERRRLAFATVLTFVALPAIWLFDRDEPSPPGSPSVAAAGVPSPEVAAVPGAADTTEPEIPVFLDNTIAVVAPAVIDVALPDPPGEHEYDGRATFKRFVDPPSSRPCSAPAVPSRAVITVTNVDNGLSTTCINTLGVSVPANVSIALDTDVYVTIADLVDAPITVRISW